MWTVDDRKIAPVDTKRVGGPWSRNFPGTCAGSRGRDLDPGEEPHELWGLSIQQALKGSWIRTRVLHVSMGMGWSPRQKH